VGGINPRIYRGGMNGGVNFNNAANSAITADRTENDARRWFLRSARIRLNDVVATKFTELSDPLWMH